MEEAKAEKVGPQERVVMPAPEPGTWQDAERQLSLLDVDLIDDNMLNTSRNVNDVVEAINQSDPFLHLSYYNQAPFLRRLAERLMEEADAVDKYWSEDD